MRKGKLGLKPPGNSAEVSAGDLSTLMHKIFRAEGTLHTVSDARGKRVNDDWERHVIVDAKYELRPSPQKPLVVEIYGYDLVGLGRCTEKLVLDNGVVLTGRTQGGSFRKHNESPKIHRIQMLDVQERRVDLYPTHAKEDAPEIDSAVFGVVSSYPLDKCGNGFASPSRPFTFSKDDPDHLKRWTTEALRLYHGYIEITVVGTSHYWKNLVDQQTLYHESIVGIRKKGGGVLPWEDLNRSIHLLENFLGWLNHCVSPVFHVKAYHKGKLVYRGYDLHPHPTVQRDGFSWFP